MKYLLLIFAVVLSTPNAFADKVIGVADGDTLTVLHDGKPLKIRLANIDAPEKSQPHGDKSKQSLSDLCFGKDAKFESETVDKYGRAVADVSCDGTNANREQVKRGYAWVYTQYNKDPALTAVERTAIAKKNGLWRDTAPVAPWFYRKQKGTDEAPKSAEPLKTEPQREKASNHASAPCITGPRGGHYQMRNGKKVYGC